MEQHLVLSQQKETQIDALQAIIFWLWEEVESTTEVTRRYVRDDTQELVDVQGTTLRTVWIKLTLTSSAQQSDRQL